MKFNMFQTTHCPSSGAYNCTGSLWFFILGRLFGRVVGGRCQAQWAYTSKQPSKYEKPEAASAVVGS